MEIGKSPLLIFKLKVGIDVQLFNADFNNKDYIKISKVIFKLVENNMK